MQVEVEVEVDLYSEAAGPVVEESYVASYRPARAAGGRALGVMVHHGDRDGVGVGVDVHEAFMINL